MSNQILVMDFSDDLKCPECNERFNEPKQLPCGHSVCDRPCLRKFIQRSRGVYVICPACKAEHVLSQSKEEMLQGNPNLSDLLAFHERHYDTISSVRNAKTLLLRKGNNIIDTKMSSVSLSSAEEPESCKECGSSDGSSEICLHCADNLCHHCHVNHMKLLKTTIYAYYNQLQQKIMEFERKLSRANYHCNDAVKRSRLQHRNERLQSLKFCMAHYFKAVRSVTDETDENFLIVLIHQGEEHMNALFEFISRDRDSSSFNSNAGTEVSRRQTANVRSFKGVVALTLAALVGIFAVRLVTR